MSSLIAASLPVKASTGGGTSKSKSRRRRRKRGGGGGGGGGGAGGAGGAGGGGGTKVSSNSIHKTPSAKAEKNNNSKKGRRGGTSRSRLAGRLGSTRQDRVQWNSAVEALKKLTFRAPDGEHDSAPNRHWIIAPVKLFATTIEQLAAIRFPSTAFRTDECAQVATALTIKFSEIEAFLKSQNVLARSDAEHILSSAFPVYCHFLRSVASEQMASFTSEQLATLLGFFTPYASCRKWETAGSAALALHTLTKVLSSNAERCTQHYSDLLALLDNHIRAGPLTDDKDGGNLSEEVGSRTASGKLYGAGEELVRCAAMDCLSGLCAGTSKVASTRAAMGGNGVAQSLFEPLCDILREFVEKAAEHQKMVQAQKEMRKERRQAIKGKAGGAWSALAFDEEEDDDSQSDSEDELESSDDYKRSHVTGPDIFSCTSATRALRGLVSVLPSLPNSRSKELLKMLHVLSAFGIDGAGERGESILSSTSTPHASTPQRLSWRTNGVFRRQQRQARYAAALGSGPQGGRASDSDSDSCNSASDTEASDAEASANIITLCSRLRLQALSCLQSISLSHHALVQTRWTDLIADSEAEWTWQGMTRDQASTSRSKQSKQRKQLTFSARQTYRRQKAAAAAQHAANKKTTASRTARSLIATVIWDSSSKVRATAASIISSMLETAPLNQWITPPRTYTPASTRSNSVGRAHRSPGRSASSSRSFISMTTRIAKSIIALHGGLFYALRRETQTSVVEHILKCISTLFRRLPYENMGLEAQDRLAQFIPEILRIIRTSLLSRSGINQVVCTGAMTALTNAVGSRIPINAVRSLLLDDATVQIQHEAKEGEKNLSTRSVKAASYLSDGTASLPMFSPIAAVKCDNISDRPSNLLRQVLQHCNGGEALPTATGGKQWPSYSELPQLALRVLHRMAKTYPQVVLQSWKEKVSVTVSACLTHPTDSLQRATALTIVGVLLQASTNDALNYLKNPINNVKKVAANSVIESDSMTPYRTSADLYAFTATFLPRCFNDPNFKVRAMACTVLAQVQRNDWQYIEASARALFFRSVLNACSDINPKVQASACLSLGSVCTLPDFYEEDVELFVIPAVKQLLRLMSSTRGDANASPANTLVVRSRATWAMANLCDVAGPIGNEGRPLSACPLAMLGKTSNGSRLQIITNACIEASKEITETTSHAVRLRASGVRALGSVAQYWLSRVGEIISASAGDPEKWMQLSSSSPAPDMLSQVMEQAISIFDTADGVDKVLWNVCHAAGRVLAAIGSYDEDTSSRDESEEPDDSCKSYINTNSEAATKLQRKRRSWADEEEDEESDYVRDEPPKIGKGAVTPLKTVKAEKLEKHMHILTGVGARFIVSLPWYLDLLKKLSEAVENATFKVRLNAAQALANRKGRRDYGTEPELLAGIFSKVVRALRTLDKASEQNVELRYSLKHVLEELVCLYLEMIDSEHHEIDDLGSCEMRKVFEFEAAFLLELLVKREFSSGIGMIKGDAQALTNPENVSIINEAHCVLKLYTKFASHMRRCSGLIGVIEKTQVRCKNLSLILGIDTQFSGKEELESSKSEQ